MRARGARGEIEWLAQLLTPSNLKFKCLNIIYLIPSPCDGLDNTAKHGNNWPGKLETWVRFPAEQLLR